MDGLMNREYIIEDGVLVIPGGGIRFGASLNLISNDEIESLGSLEEVDGSVVILDCPNLRDLGRLRVISGSLNIWNCGSLSSIETIEAVGGPILVPSELDTGQIPKLLNATLDIQSRNCQSKHDLEPQSYRFRRAAPKSLRYG